MYLKGSSWTMRKKRRPIRWTLVIFLIFAFSLFIYVNQVVVPQVIISFENTPTPTRNPEAVVSEAADYFQQGKLPQAIASYKEAIRNNPQDPSVYVALARAQIYAGAYAEAQTSAEDALLLNPNNSMAYAMHAWALNFQQNYGAALESVQRALDLDPQNPTAHAVYAEILAEQYLAGVGEITAIEKAAEASRTAVNLAPNSLEAHRARGYVLYITDNYVEAINEYQQAINISSNISNLHYQLAQCYRALEDYAKAEEEFSKANTLNPQDPLPNLSLSRMYFRLGEKVKAVQYAEQAVKAAPTDTPLRGNLGTMYYQNEDYVNAEIQLRLVVNGGTTEDGFIVQPLPLINDPRVAEYYYIYGYALVVRGKCGEAIEIFNTIIATVPGDDVAFFNATEGLKTCQSNINSPTPQPTP